MSKPCGIAPKMLQLAVHLTFIALLALCFALVEVQIEGAAGWAANLPTWRIERHWILELIWGGRPLTGYHLWIFSFMFLVFHFPLVCAWRCSVRLEARVLASLMLFWITEDFLWFALNPAYQLRDLFSGRIPWHKHTILFLPHDYWIFLLLGAALMYYSFCAPGRGTRSGEDERQPPGA